MHCSALGALGVFPGSSPLSRSSRLAHNSDDPHDGDASGALVGEGRLVLDLLPLGQRGEQPRRRRTPEAALALDRPLQGHLVRGRRPSSTDDVDGTIAGDAASTDDTAVAEIDDGDKSQPARRTSLSRSPSPAQVPPRKRRLVQGRRPSTNGDDDSSTEEGASAEKVEITKTGYSPRIIEAKLFGTGGVTTVTGEQLEVALGGYSTWMTFEKVVGK